MILENAGIQVDTLKSKNPKLYDSIRIAMDDFADQYAEWRIEKQKSGNKNSIFKTLGASNHTKEHRDIHDFYATDPKALELLLDIETFNENVWEPACGQGHLSKVLIRRGYKVKSTDLFDYGYGTPNVDFLHCYEHFNGDIITNPPYKYAVNFVKKALELIPNGNRVAMFLKLTFLEGKERKKLFELNPPKIIYISSSRLACAKNGDFSNAQSAVCYAWFIWQKGFKGDTIIKWFN